jgi:hypothetical protein
MKKFGIFILVLVFIGAIMYFTNPDNENFSNYLDRVSSRNITQYASGTQGITETNVADLANARFERQDKYIYSIYNITSPSSVSEFSYLGLFGIFFKIS